MSATEFINKLGKQNPKIVSALLKGLKSFSFVNKMIQKEYDGIMKELEGALKPYKGKFESMSRLPETGRSHEDILTEMKALKAIEEAKWRKGFVSGAVYHGDAEHIDFLNEVYALNSQSNPLHADVWPSTTRFEAEIVSMTANMLGAGEVNPHAAPGEEICGVVTSGGTESILLAMKTYRDHAKSKKKITRPQMIIPVTAHAAFDKAAEYFKITPVRIPVDSEFRADVAEARKAVNRNTIVIVGSAPCFPQGVVDPIAELSALALEKKIGFHTDACLGGFVLPWAEKLGYDVPGFDFRLPGVTSISADTHKYGYAAKGTSVILYRGVELRHYQFYKTSEWPGGLYFSPTFAGSRPGGLSAACWAAMVSIGESGYMDATRRILETSDVIKQGVAGIPDLHILGNPLWNIAFASDVVDIYKVMDHMSKKGWSLNGLHKPSCVHICLTLRHTLPGIAERFLKDLADAVEQVKANPDEKGDMAPVYGMAATFPDRSMITTMLDMYIDLLYKV